MTTAYNFPDLDISPIDCLSTTGIYPRLSDNSELDITAPSGFGNIFSQSSRQETTVDVTISLDSLPTASRAPVAVDENETANYSSEEVFRRLEAEAKAVFCSSSGSEEEPAGSCMSSSILRGISVFVDLQCCDESAKAVKSKLRRMGAVVSRRLSLAVTHVVFARGGRKSTLQSVLSMQKRPHLLDPHWVHACYFSQCRVPEQNYSLYECRFFVDSLRRLSTAGGEEEEEAPVAALIESLEQIELTPPPENGPDTTAGRRRRSNSAVSLSESAAGELTFDRPMSATQLLAKIEKLSKRLDELAGKDDMAAMAHSNRCTSRQEPAAGETAVLRTAGVNTRQIPAFPAAAALPLRRRSHGAFGLPHRAPHSTAVAVQQATREAAGAENGIRDVPNRPPAAPVLSRPRPKVEGIDDMRKTLSKDLKQIHQTLKNNSQFRKKRDKKTAGGLSQQQQQRPRMPAIQEKLDESEAPLRTPKGPARRQIVPTASQLINRLQSVPSSEEFAVSQRKSRLQRRGLVFTGFNRQEEAVLREVAEVLELSVQQDIGQGTRCVVSCRGQRTLTTLKAVVLGIPVVRADWLSHCEREDRLVSLRQYIYPIWLQTLEKDKTGLFSRLGEILVVEGCSPPSVELRWMIRKCGGRIASGGDESGLIVSPENQIVQIPWTDTGRQPPAVVPERYILDCITEGHLLNIADYSDVSVSIVEGPEEEDEA